MYQLLMLVLGFVWSSLNTQCCTGHIISLCNLLLTIENECLFHFILVLLHGMLSTFNVTFTLCTWLPALLTLSVIKSDQITWHLGSTYLSTVHLPIHPSIHPYTHSTSPSTHLPVTRGGTNSHHRGPVSDLRLILYNDTENVPIIINLNRA